ncbi:MAG: hypothetical protein AB1730_06485 [Myxococcota bacterium]
MLLAPGLSLGKDREANVTNPLGIRDYAAIGAVVGYLGVKERSTDGSAVAEDKATVYGLRISFGQYTHRTVGEVLAGVEFNVAFGYAQGFKLPLWATLEGFAHIALVNVRWGVFAYRFHLVPAFVWNAYNGVAGGLGIRSTMSIVPALTIDATLVGLGSIHATGSLRGALQLIIEPIHTSIGLEFNVGQPERLHGATAVSFTLALRLPFEKD